MNIMSYYVTSEVFTLTNGRAFPLKRLLDVYSYLKD